MGLLALGLGLLVVTGVVRLWHVYVFAFLLGCAAAFDSPARQTFVAELVEERDLPNAVALNSTSFNAARMIGPAIAGGLIAGVGSGWVFLINALSFLAVLCSLSLLRLDRLRRGRRAVRGRGSLLDGFRYVLRRTDLKVILFMLFLVGTFGLNFPIFISTMAVTIFHAGAGQYGLLTSMMAAGSVTGALMAAARAKPGITVLLAGTATFGAGCAAAALMPSYALFGLALFVIGIAAQTLTTSTNSLIQTSTEPAHARPRHCHPARARARRDADRRADRGLGGRHVRPALGAWRRRRGRFPRGGDRHPLSRNAPACRRGRQARTWQHPATAHALSVTSGEVVLPLLSEARSGTADAIQRVAWVFVEGACSAMACSGRFSLCTAKGGPIQSGFKT